MVAKRSSRALALLLALPTAALALGMGDIRLLSPLNAPLDAEVDLVDVAPDEANTVQAQLASRETFARYGLDWPAYLAGVQVRTVRAPDGRQMLKLRSTDAISEPFITLLVEVNWARGHLVREYTMLLDPPVYTPGQSGVAGPPVSAPATGSGAREGAIARAGDPAPAATAAAGPESSAASAAPPARASAAGGDAGGGSMHVVQRGETLSAIASSEAGAGANTPRTRSLMVAIYQANPRAFEKNMNVLHSGALLRIPDAAQAAAVSPSEAAAEIGRQYAAWRSSSGAAAAPSGERCICRSSWRPSRPRPHRLRRHPLARLPRPHPRRLPSRRPLSSRLPHRRPLRRRPSPKRNRPRRLPKHRRRRARSPRRRPFPLPPEAHSLTPSWATGGRSGCCSWCSSRLRGQGSSVRAARRSSTTPSAA
ncbi:MAG: hypothetical protein E6K44_12045 [Gammaproteobacteria bacterium]|nr:MAG: hypothetical protein E6K44_12045 [Gammaproteobacteria bacterium]